MLNAEIVYYHVQGASVFLCLLMSILSLFLSDLSVFAAARGKTQDSAKVKGEKDLDNDWSESDSEIEEITADFEIDEETDQPATCGGKKAVSGITRRSADLV